MIFDMIPDIIIAALILIFFVAAPLVAQRTIRTPAHPELSPISPGDCPAAVLEFFDLNTKQLEKEGFTAVTTAVQKKSSSDRTTTYLRLLINQKAGDMAMCTYIQNPTITEKYVEFCTEFSTDKEISTNNSKVPNVFKKIPDKQLIQFPHIKDLNYLYELHTRETEKLVDQFSRKILPPKGRELEHLANSMIKGMELYVKMGYFYLDRPARVYRLTLKGAYITTWKTIFKFFRR